MVCGSSTYVFWPSISLCDQWQLTFWFEANRLGLLAATYLCSDQDSGVFYIVQVIVTIISNKVACSSALHYYNIINEEGHILLKQNSQPQELDKSISFNFHHIINSIIYICDNNNLPTLSL